MTNSQTPILNKSQIRREIEKAVTQYYASDIDKAQFTDLQSRINVATDKTTFREIVGENYGSDDALGLRFHIAKRLGISESKLPRPRESQLHTYTLGQAVEDLYNAQEQSRPECRGDDL